MMVVGESGLGKSTLINSLFLTDIYGAEYPGPSQRVKKTSKVNYTADFPLFSLFLVKIVFWIKIEQVLHLLVVACCWCTLFRIKHPTQPFFVCLPLFLLYTCKCANSIIYLIIMLGRTNAHYGAWIGRTIKPVLCWYTRLRRFSQQWQVLGANHWGMCFKFTSNTFLYSLVGA